MSEAMIAAIIGLFGAGSQSLKSGMRLRVEVLAIGEGGIKVLESRRVEGLSVIVLPWSLEFL